MREPVLDPTKLFRRQLRAQLRHVVDTLDRGLDQVQHVFRGIDRGAAVGINGDAGFAALGVRPRRHSMPFCVGSDPAPPLGGGNIFVTASALARVNP